MANEPNAPQPSPLTEADSQSLDLLFARIDQHITLGNLRSSEAAADLGAVVAELRRQRAAWAKAEASGATRAPRAKKTTAATQTSLSDLGLDDEPASNGK